MSDIKPSVESIGRLADSVDNFIAAFNIRLPDALRVQAFKEALPEWRDTLRKAYVDLAGENPWEQTNE